MGQIRKETQRMACLPDADQTGERARARAAAMACSGGSAPLVAMLHTELTTRGWRPSQRRFAARCIASAGSGNGPASSWVGLTRSTKQKNHERQTSLE